MKDRRERMVYEIRERYGLDSPRVLSVMLQVPRHKFVLKENQSIAYKDFPVPIGFDQTMSQPYTVALMTDLLIGSRKQDTRNKQSLADLVGRKKGKVLEIGTGSGYQAAVLSKLFRQVYTIEIVTGLAEKARRILKKLCYKNVHVKKGSGEWGWKENAPYDAIMITAGVKKVPDELFEQLKAGGVLVAPIGKGNDKVMMRFTKKKEGKLSKEKFGIFHFVPFIEERN